MAFAYKFFLEDDSMLFVKHHATVNAIARGMIKRRESGGPWENVMAVEILLEPNEPQRIKDDLLVALQEFFTNHYTNLVEVFDYLDNTEWTAEELTIPEPET